MPAAASQDARRQAQRHDGRTTVRLQQLIALSRVQRTVKKTVVSALGRSSEDK